MSWPRVASATGKDQTSRQTALKLEENIQSEKLWKKSKSERYFSCWIAAQRNTSAIAEEELVQLSGAGKSAYYNLTRPSTRVCYNPSTNAPLHARAYTHGAIMSI